MRWLLASLFMFIVTTSGGLAKEVAGQATAVDGDTLHLGSESIRLEGIDAPELSQRCSDGQGKLYACGRQSKAVLTEFLKTGPIDCQESGKDRYGRLLAYCTAGSVDINATMVRQGWALAFVKYSTRYREVEAQAKAAKLGLWAGTFEAPWDYRAGAIAATPTGPEGCTIKGNLNRKGERIYFLPFHSLYSRVKIDTAKGERWFCSEDEAQKAGWHERCGSDVETRKWATAVSSGAAPPGL